MLKNGRAAVAHQLDLAAVTSRAERHHALDGFGGFKRDVEENQIGSAARQRKAKGLTVGELFGVDPRAVQDER